MKAGQDTQTIHAYKTFHRDDEGLTGQYPAIREIKVEGHIPELKTIIELFMGMADTEDLRGRGDRGDMSKMPSEPMRNAAGASMMFGNAALPFKDIVRNFDRFTMSTIQSLVGFNRGAQSDQGQGVRLRRHRPGRDLAGGEGDARHAARPARQHDDARGEDPYRHPEAGHPAAGSARSHRHAGVRDRGGPSSGGAGRGVCGGPAGLAGSVRGPDPNTLAQAFKNIAQGQKNLAAADVDKINAALDVLERGDKSAPGAGPRPSAFMQTRPPRWRARDSPVPRVEVMMARQDQELKALEATLLQRVRQEQHPVTEDFRRLVSVWEERALRVLTSCPREDLVWAQAQVRVFSSILEKLSAPPEKENTNG
jgi:hypothetical protein